jgi:hypothetical protein
MNPLNPHRTPTQLEVEWMQQDLQATSPDVDGFDLFIEMQDRPNDPELKELFLSLFFDSLTSH